MFVIFLHSKKQFNKKDYIVFLGRVVLLLAMLFFNRQVNTVYKTGLFYFKFSYFVAKTGIAALGVALHLFWFENRMIWIMREKHIYRSWGFIFCQEKNGWENLVLA